MKFVSFQILCKTNLTHCYNENNLISFLICALEFTDVIGWFASSSCSSFLGHTCSCYNILFVGLCSGAKSQPAIPLILCRHYKFNGNTNVIVWFRPYSLSDPSSRASTGSRFAKQYLSTYTWLWCWRKSTIKLLDWRHIKKQQ